MSLEDPSSMTGLSFRARVDIGFRFALFLNLEDGSSAPWPLGVYKSEGTTLVRLRKI